MKTLKSITTPGVSRDCGDHVLLERANLWPYRNPGIRFEFSGSFAYVGQMAVDAEEAVAQARLTLQEACDRSNKPGIGTYQIRLWDDIAQEARKVLVFWGALPQEAL